MDLTSSEHDPVTSFYEHSNEPRGVHETGNILDPLRKYQFSRNALHHGVN
jgi:hypothetical protein